MRKKLSLSLKENMEWAHSKFGCSADFYAKEISIADISCGIVFFDGIASVEKLWVVFLDRLSVDNCFENGKQLLDYIMNNSELPVGAQLFDEQTALTEKLASGMAALFIDGCEQAILLSVQEMKHRSVDKPSAEGDVRGSQEGFTDLLRINISLIRRLVRTEDLIMEVAVAGRATHTEYALCYQRGLVPEKLLKQIKEKLSAVDIPFLFDSAYLNPFIKKEWGGIFQPVGFTERPVTACAKICEGKLVVLVNGSPFALIYPYFFSENFESLDDYSFSAYFAAITRILKYLAFAAAILLPGLYVMAVNHTPEMIPRVLLEKILEGAEKTPLSVMAEMILVLFVLEVIRIAGLRMPKASSGSVSLVAALAIGTTAVEAGLMSSPIVLCAAISAVALYTLPNLYEQIVVLRVLFLLLCGLFGPIGLAAGLLFFITSLSHSNVNTGAYLFPLWPVNKWTFRDGIVRMPWNILSQNHFDIKKVQKEEEKD